MYRLLLELDRNILLAINAAHSAEADQIMVLFTSKAFWIPFYVGLALWLYWKVKEKAVTLVLFALLGLGLSDAISARIFKPFFERLRPCHEPSLSAFLHLPDGCGGQFGFVSSHAANTFGLAFFLWIILRKQFPAVRWLFAWAAIVSYSRIYLAAHYPLDIAGGALVGLGSAFITYRVYDYLARRAGAKASKWWVRKWMDWA